MLRHEMPRTIALARDLLSLAERNGEPVQVAVACRALGFSLFFAGELVEADPLLSRGAALADGLAGSDFAAYGEDPSIICRLGGGWLRGLTGAPDTALRTVGEGLARARASGNPHPIAWALGILAKVHKLRVRRSAAERAAAEAVEVAGRHRLPQWLGFAQQWRGWALCRLGEVADGLALLEEAQRRLRETGAVLHVDQRQLPARRGLRARRQAGGGSRARGGGAGACRGAMASGIMLAEIHRLHAEASAR